MGEEQEGSPSDGRVKGAGEEMLFSKHTSIISVSFLHWNTHTHTHGGKTKRRIRSRVKQLQRCLENQLLQ